MKRTLLTLGAAASLAWGAPALAADFTFDVPVRVQNLPALTTLQVQCSVWTVGPRDPTTATAELGSGMARVPVTGGNFDGTVTVEVNNSTALPSTEARSYSCVLSALGTSSTGRTFEASYSMFESTYESATGQQIDRIIYSTRAALP